MTSMRLLRLLSGSALRIALLATAFSLAAPANAEDGDEASLRQAITESNQAIQGEVLKRSAAKIAVQQGLAAYRAQARLQNKAVTLQSDMKQSGQQCQAMDAAEALAGGKTKARALVHQDQRKAMPLARNVNTQAAVDSMHRVSNEKFCSEDDAALGVCKATTDPKYTNLAGADQNAMYLFQSRSGADTYEGSKASGQVEAVDAYVARVVSGGVPPQVLRAAGGNMYERNPQARAYAELARRYQAFLSMSAYSLNSIKGTRAPAQ